MSIHALCTPRPSVHAADRRATLLNLDTFLKGQVNGPEFFAENYFTNGMLTLVDRAFRHLGGSGAGSSVFLLSQAMGGGKTHSMVALGLLALDRMACSFGQRRRHERMDCRLRSRSHSGGASAEERSRLIPRAMSLRGWPIYEH